MDYELVKLLIEKTEPGTILIILFAGWLYLKKMKSDLTDILKVMNEDIKEIKSKISDIDKRLIVVETVLHMQDCCILKQDDKQRKAE